MEIIRDGKTYELTEEELLDAYLEKQFNSDIELIKHNLEYFDAAEEGLEDNNAFLQEAATKYREIFDNLDFNFSVALDDAVSTVLRKYRKKI